MAKKYRYTPATWEYLKCLYYGYGVQQNIKEAFNLAINRLSLGYQEKFVEILKTETTSLVPERLLGLGKLLKFMLPHNPWEEEKYTKEEKSTILRANQMISKAAESGLLEAEEAVAYIMGRGGGEIGLPKDEAKAIEWYIKAAEQGSDNAKYELVLYYLHGTFEFDDNPDKISLEQARFWFKQLSKEKQKEYSSIAKCISRA